MSTRHHDDVRRQSALVRALTDEAARHEASDDGVAMREQLREERARLERLLDARD
jgi:hypothetical protein